MLSLSRFNKWQIFLHIYDWIELWRHVSIYTICSWTTQLPVIDFHFSNALRMHHFAYEYHFFLGGGTLQLAIQSQNAPFCLKKKSQNFPGCRYTFMNRLKCLKMQCFACKIQKYLGCGIPLNGSNCLKMQYFACKIKKKTLGCGRIPLNGLNSLKMEYFASKIPKFLGWETPLNPPNSLKML